MKIQDLKEGCAHGEYYCSTDKKWKCRQGPKQTREGVAEAGNGRPGTTPGFNDTLDADEKRRQQRSQERKAQDKSTMQGIDKNRAKADAYRKSGVAEDKGMTQYNAFKREWRAKHGSDAKVPGYDSKEYTSYVYRHNDKKQSVAEGLPQTLRKVVPGYAKREIDKKMDAGKFGKTDADKDANFHRYKKIQDKLKEGAEQIYNILALDKGNALKKPTKLKWKASSLEDIFDALAAQDWYPLEINGVEVIAGKRLKQGVAEDEAPLKHHTARVSYHKEGDPHRRYEAIFKTTHNGGKEETEKRAKAAFAAKKKIVYDIVHEQGVAEAKQRLDPSCWQGYKKQGTKMKGDTRVNNCVKEDLEETYDGDEFFEAYGELWYNEDEQLDEAEYQGRSVPLGKPMQGDVKKFKVYVKDPSTGNVKKVNFGDPDMKIRKSNPAARRSFRARHNCDNPGPRTKARFWSCRKW